MRTKPAPWPDKVADFCRNFDNLYSDCKSKHSALMALQAGDGINGGDCHDSFGTYMKERQVGVLWTAWQTQIFVNFIHCSSSLSSINQTPGGRTERFSSDPVTADLRCFSRISDVKYVQVSRKYLRYLPF